MAASVASTPAAGRVAVAIVRAADEVAIAAAVAADEVAIADADAAKSYHSMQGARLSLCPLQFLEHYTQARPIHIRRVAYR